MRALVLILSCVVLLATLQAVYSSIEAANNRALEEQRRLHKHHRNHENAHHQKHHKDENDSYTEDQNRIEDHHHKLSNEESNLNSYKASNHHDSNPDTPPVIDFNPHGTSTPKNYASHKIEYRLGNVVSDVNRNRQSKLRLNPSYQTGYLDEPTQNQLAQKESFISKTEGGSRKWGEKPNSRMDSFSKISRKNSGVRRNSHTSCITDADCDGGCCIKLKNGKTKCKIPDFRNEGDKCASSCVCKSGLQCYVSLYRNNGQKKQIREGRRIVGRCMADSMADLTKGYFLPSHGDNSAKH